LFPCGVYERICSTDIKSLDISDYFGIIKCTVRAPNNLKFGVLPVRHPESRKLVFPLGLDKSGLMQGTWVVKEVQTALEYGYKMVAIHEVWHYRQKDYLFTDYVNFFLKLKQQASGYPAWVKSEDDKRLYVEQYKRQEGITLETVEKNPGMRAVAKLYLNSLWGKLGAKQERRSVKVTQGTDDFYNIIEDHATYNWQASNFEFVNLQQPDEKVLFYLVLNDNGSSKRVENTNEILAAFTTSYARIRLFKLLDNVGFENVLYFDTDSCIYEETVQNEHIYKTQLGDYLGELTDELEGQDCVAYVGIAPKTYALKMSDGSTIVKSKGFTLNYESSLIINFESMKDMVLNPDPQKSLNTSMFTLRRSDKSSYEIETRYETKRLKFSYDKGVLIEKNGGGHRVLPFNHKDIKNGGKIVL